MSAAIESIDRSQEKKQFVGEDNELSGPTELDILRVHPAIRTLEMRFCSPGEEARGRERCTGRDR